MIWGSQYDQVIKFIKENKGSTDLDPEIGHTNIELKSTPDVSGAEGVNDIMKNIYDLQGNYWEGTAQAYNDYLRVERGGFYNRVAVGEFHPASDGWNYDPVSTYSHSTSRATLYVTL